jgi:hypothetical protein
MQRPSGVRGIRDDHPILTNPYMRQEARSDYLIVARNAVMLNEGRVTLGAIGTCTSIITDVVPSLRQVFRDYHFRSASQIGPMRILQL